MKWQEQISKEFRNQDIGISTISGNEGGVTWNCEVEHVDTVDENLFYRHQNFQSGVLLAMMAIEPRGTT